MTIVCSECGHQNDDDSDFCSSCGEPLEWTGVRVGEEEPAPIPEAVATVVVPPPAPEAPAPAAAPTPPAAPEAPPVPVPTPEPPAAETPPAPVEPPKPKKIPRLTRKEKEAAAAAAAAPPPPPAAPAAPPAPPARPATPPPAPAPAAPPAPAPVAESPAAPAEAETPPPAPPAAAPSGPGAKAPAAPVVPKGPTARPPAPRAKTPPPPPVEDAEEEAARLAAEEDERRLAEQARRLVVPVAREPEPAPVAAPVAAAPAAVKLTWWQRLVRWFKRVILRQKPATAAAVAAAPVAAGTPAPATPPPAGATAAVGARAPAAQKPGDEVQRRTPKAVEEEAPTVSPGDLICTQCGTGNSPTNKFCKRCGHSLAEAPVAKKPPWWKRFFGFFRFRKKKRFAAGERRKKQLEGGKQRKSFFWIFQSGIFKIVGLVTVAVIALAVLKNWRGPLEKRFKDNFNAVHDLILPGFKHVTPVSATASSSLNKAHLPKAAIDQITNDSWISKPTKRDGVLQTITVHFESPIRVGKIGIRNGDQTTEKTYVNQARLHTALIFFFDKKGKRIVGKAKKCNFDDKPEFQTCSVDVRDVGYLKIRAITVYKSQKGNSLAIAEIEPLRRT